MQFAGAMAILPRAMERVVVADDNPAMTSVMTIALRMWGWDVVVAHDGFEAVDAIRRVRPAVGLIDIGLPEISGLEVARLVRTFEVAPRLLVALSGYGDEEDHLRSREAGFDHHLTKPADPDTLQGLITTWATGRASA